MTLPRRVRPRQHHFSGGGDADGKKDPFLFTCVPHSYILPRLFLLVRIAAPPICPTPSAPTRLEQINGIACQEPRQIAPCLSQASCNCALDPCAAPPTRHVRMRTAIAASLPLARAYGSTGLSGRCTSSHTGTGTRTHTQHTHYHTHIHTHTPPSTAVRLSSSAYIHTSSPGPLPAPGVPHAARRLASSSTSRIATCT